LLKLGTLNQRHEILKDEVEKLKKQTEKTVDFKPVDVKHVPDLPDLNKIFDDIKRMKDAIEELKKNLTLVITFVRRIELTHFKLFSLL